MWIKSLPRDLIFAIAALTCSFFGIISSTEIYKAMVNIPILTIIGLWTIGKVTKTYPKEFPLPLLLEIFSAWIFFFAMQNSGLASRAASWIQAWPPFLLFLGFFLVAQTLAHFMPRPVAFAVLFSIALVLFTGISLLLIGANIALAAAFPLFDKPNLRGARATLILVLFAAIAIPSCLFWPIR